MSIVIVIINEKEGVYVRNDIPEDMARKICEDLDSSLGSDKSLEAAEPVLDPGEKPLELDYQTPQQQRAAALEKKKEEEQKRKEARDAQIIDGVRALVWDYLKSEYGKNPFIGRDLQDFVILSDKEYVITKWASAHRFGTLVRQYPTLQVKFQEQLDTKPTLFMAVNVAEKEAKREPDMDIKKNEYGVILMAELIDFARKNLPEVFHVKDWDDIVQLPTAAFQRLRGAGYIIGIDRTHFRIAPDAKIKELMEQDSKKTETIVTK